MNPYHLFHRRRSIRLPGHDYSSPGAYFVTICTNHRKLILGEIIGSEMRLSHTGTIIQQMWVEMPNHYSGVSLDVFIIMPNHLHGIIHILDGAQFMVTLGGSSHTLGTIVRGFKARSTSAINQEQNRNGISIWQRNYHDHIIRNDDEIRRFRRYIAENPAHWAHDPENPSVISNNSKTTSS